jgi:hypothetical protein
VPDGSARAERVFSLADQDKAYLKIVVDSVRVCANYRPKLGQGSGGGYALADFQRLYGADPFYSWFGLDHPLMYAAHKAAGGMTSIYRQIGIGCEHLFNQILQDQLKLSADEASWSYNIAVAGGGKRTLYLDGRIPVAKIPNPSVRKSIRNWMLAGAKSVGVATGIAGSLTGAVFEVRQGYKSKDSKRQNADLANAATAYTQSYLPCAVILSSQIDTDILLRYRAAKWLVLTGFLGKNDPLLSTYDFMRIIIGYDLAAFFIRNSAVLKKEIDLVLKALLTP